MFQMSHYNNEVNITHLGKKPPKMIFLVEHFRMFWYVPHVLPPIFVLTFNIQNGMG